MANEPFDPEEFVERLAWRTIESNREEGNGTFDPLLMHQTFSQAIKDLELLLERQHKKCEILEQQCRDEEGIHWQDISKLQENNKVFFNYGLSECLLDRDCQGIIANVRDHLESSGKPLSF